MNWKDRHRTAMADPQGPEIPIVALLGAWETYGRQHELRFESSIGDDSVLGPAWEQIGESLLTLLNGECGRLDCGTLDEMIRGTLHAEGFDD